MTNDTWGQARETLQTTIGKNNYLTWIEPLTFVSCENGVVEFGVQTSFQGDWVSRNFGDEILRQFEKFDTPVNRLKFSVQANRPAPAKRSHTSQNRNPASEAFGSRPAFKSRISDEMMPGAPLDKRFTFDSFVVGKPNELAHAAARRVAEGGPVSFNPLFLYGGVGLGKTHLMHAMAWELQRRSPELRVVYLSAEQFMYRFIQALRDKQMMDFKSLFRSVDVLMVDDVQFIAGKDSTQDEFFHTFNALIDQQKQIIISADRAPGEIDGLEERISSRLQWGLVVDLHPTDYELRLGILQQKVEQYRAQYQELKISIGVLEFLAQRISNNVRVLEGALTRLFALASLVGREITLDMAQESLADILRQSDRKVTMDEIMRKTCDYYNVRMSDMLSPKRSRNIARPRQMAMWLSKHLTQRSYPEIGKRFGNRDHTTVIHAVRKIEELKAQDSQVAEDAELLRRMLEA